MVDAKTLIVTELSKILPVYYDIYTGPEQTPCITYIESGNRVEANGDTLGYSWINFDIKIWGKDLSTLMTYVASVDTTMRTLGFTRQAYVELTEFDLIELVLTYEGLAQENFN